MDIYKNDFISDYKFNTVGKRSIFVEFRDMYFLRLDE